MNSHFLQRLWTLVAAVGFISAFGAVSAASQPSSTSISKPAECEKSQSQIKAPKTLSGELPAAQTTPAESGKVTYTLHRPKEPTEEQQKMFDQIDKSMQAAIGYYNRHTRLVKHLNVTYNSSVPTADGNINGSIRVGGMRNTRVLLHEIGHCMGIGQHGNYFKLMVKGFWQGENAITLLKELTNDPNAQLHGDRMHFWPYGLNYDHEVKSEEDLIRHAKLVEAMVKDMEGQK